MTLTRIFIEKEMGYPRKKKKKDIPQPRLNHCCVVSKFSSGWI